jgi:hypothetical protein
LGDAFKEILASIYVLARDIGRDCWNEPLIITTPGAKYNISLEVDRINQTVSSNVSESSVKEGFYIHNREEREMRANFTEIEVHIPQKSTTDARGYVNAMRAYVIEYSFVNLHVSFEIKIENPDIAEVLKCPQSLYLPSQYEKSGNAASNTSIYYYTYLEFQNFIEGITVDNNSLLAYDLFRLKFREGTTLRKTGLLTSLTVANLKSNQNDEIRTVYNALKEAMGRPVSDTNASKKKLLSLPFEMSKGDRKEAFRNRIQSCGIEVQGIKYDQIKRNPEKKNTDRWTQSTVFYYLRPILEKAGIKLSTTTRKTIQGQYIKAICKELGITRAELGIVAADRAQIYFRGRWEDVGIDELDTLMHYGVDVLIIEKEGVAQALSHYADEYGIALINTRGFLTENVSILSNLARKTDGNVAILTDYDISGMLIAIKAPKGVPRIGIDFETLKYFGIEKSSLSALEENYEPSESHLKAVENHVDIVLIDGSSEDSFDLASNIQYLRHKRIEIDSVIKYVGIAKFWTFIIDRLEKEFPNKNYNRAINIPSSVIPEPLEKLTKIINRKVSKILQPYIIEKKKSLEIYEGFLPIKEYENNIMKEFKNAVENNVRSLTPLLDDILSVVKKYDLED